jgi:hypothetical protein
MDTEGIIYLVIAAIVIVSSFVGLWYLSKKTPRGVVLGICIVLYILSKVIEPGTVRSLYVLSGTMGVIGFFGGILGIIDLFRKKKSESQN